jgi:hypothetical protein
MSRAHLSLSADAVASLADLLATIADVPGISQEHRYELKYCRGQVHPRMPAVEVLVLAGLLHEAPERLALDRATRTTCRWWSAELARALTGPASGPQPLTGIVVDDQDRAERRQNSEFLRSSWPVTASATSPGRAARWRPIPITGAEVGSHHIDRPPHHDDHQGDGQQQGQDELGR